jgi:hypothetical protein
LPSSSSPADDRAVRPLRRARGHERRRARQPRQPRHPMWRLIGSGAIADRDFVQIELRGATGRRPTSRSGCASRACADARCRRSGAAA